MTTYTTSIFVELEIKVSGTLTGRNHKDDDAVWEDLTVEGIGYERRPRTPFPTVKWETVPLFTPPHGAPIAIVRDFRKAAALDRFLDNVVSEFSEQIEDALSDQVPEGPDADDARDAAIDRELMERAR